MADLKTDKIVIGDLNHLQGGSSMLWLQSYVESVKDQP